MAATPPRRRRCRARRRSLVQLTRRRHGRLSTHGARATHHQHRTNNLRRARTSGAARAPRPPAASVGWNSHISKKCRLAVKERTVPDGGPTRAARTPQFRARRRPARDDPVVSFVVAPTNCTDDHTNRITTHSLMPWRRQFPRHRARRTPAPPTPARARRVAPGTTSNLNFRKSRLTKAIKSPPDYKDALRTRASPARRCAAPLGLPPRARPDRPRAATTTARTLARALRAQPAPQARSTAAVAAARTRHAQPRPEDDNWTPALDLKASRVTTQLSSL